MKINVIGLGYIGLPTAAVFADYGVDVVGVDVFPEIVDTINAGKIHIEEPGLAELVNKVVTKGMLKASISPVPADAFIISVPTPSNKDEFQGCDLSIVLEAAKSILPVVKKGDVVIIESTISPRSTEDVIAPLFENKGFIIGKDIFLAHCPERVLPGSILEEVINNNRIIGGMTPQCSEEAAKVYGIFVKGELIITEAKTAEMSKLMENTFRDVNIALANELAIICNELEINVLDVINMANKHPRVNLHKPGPGVGGHCLAVDPYFIYDKARESAKLIKLARDINVNMPQYVANCVKRFVHKGDIITVMGITYKPDVDDLRESPALKIIDILKNEGYEVKIHDPHVSRNGLLTLEDALRDSSLALCLTGHSIFKSYNICSFRDNMKKPIIFDTTDTINFKEIEVYNYGNLYTK